MSNRLHSYDSRHHHPQQHYTVRQQQQQQQQQQQLPQASLGKLSFQERLEVYYSLVQPDLLLPSCDIPWKKRFEQIWDKFGGSIEGEQLLAKKLLNKYGTTTIAFQTVTSTGTATTTTVTTSTTSKLNHKNNNSGTIVQQQHPNEWYELNSKETNSGCLDFLSDRLDPIAVLRLHSNKNNNNNNNNNSNSCTSTALMEETNPFLRSNNNKNNSDTEPILYYLDRVDQFRSYLPICDPLHFIAKSSRQQQQNPTVTTTAETTNQRPNHKNPLRHVPVCVVDTVQWHETGPYSLLYDALVHRQRIRVVIRYVNSIRGTITGFIIAFDQHMNLLLRDVDEQYSPRRLTYDDDDDDDHCESLSNGQAELRRRIDCTTQPRNIDAKRDGSTKSKPQQYPSKGTWAVRQRHMRQIMVRGDVIVLIYKASEEQSAHPMTNATTRTGDTDVTVAPQLKPRYQEPDAFLPQKERRIGTPGTFVVMNNYNQQRQQRHNNHTKNDRRNHHKTDRKSNL